MKYFSWIVTLPITIAVVVFAVSNTADATLSFWPLPWAVNLPVYFVVLSSLFLGFLIGGAIAWISGGKRRRRARQLAEQVRVQARQMADLQRQQAEAAPPARAATGPSHARPAEVPRLTRASR